MWVRVPPSAPLAPTRSVQHRDCHGERDSDYHQYGAQHDREITSAAIGDAHPPPQIRSIVETGGPAVIEEAGGDEQQARHKQDQRISSDHATLLSTLTT